MQEISVQDAYTVLQKQDAILIDVREEDEYLHAHIQGAQLAPLSDLPRAIQNISIPEGKKIIVQCLKGGRSAQAIEFLTDNIFKDKDVYNMVGGIKDWAEQGLPVTFSETRK